MSRTAFYHLSSGDALINISRQVRLKMVDGFLCWPRDIATHAWRWHVEFLIEFSTRSAQEVAIGRARARAPAFRLISFCYRIHIHRFIGMKHVLSCSEDLGIPQWKCQRREILKSPTQPRNHKRTQTYAKRKNQDKLNTDSAMTIFKNSRFIAVYNDFLSHVFVCSTNKVRVLSESSSQTPVSVCLLLTIGA